MSTSTSIFPRLLGVPGRATHHSWRIRTPESGLLLQPRGEDCVLRYSIGRQPVSQDLARPSTRERLLPNHNLFGKLPTGKSHLEEELGNSFVGNTLARFGPYGQYEPFARFGVRNRIDRKSTRLNSSHLGI